MTLIVAATGHRPDKLGGYGPKAQGRVYTLAYEWLECFRPDQLISGMALGWDQACAEAALALGIPLIAAIPFEGQESRWPPASQEHYRMLRALATEVRIIAPGGYSPFVMQLRNETMVLWANLILALWDGSAGGTCNCLANARTFGAAKKPIINLWDRYAASLAA